MAEDLEARAKALGASDRARRQLLADVSHELMTPLTAIRGYTETLGMADLQLDDATRGRYLGDHRRRNPEARGAHRRSARTGPARRRRRDAGVQGCGDLGPLRTRRRPSRPDDSGTGHHHRAPHRTSGPRGPRRSAAAGAGTPEPRLERAPAHAGGRHNQAQLRPPPPMESTSRSRTLAPASRRSTCPACSIASTKPIRRGPSA